MASSDIYASKEPPKARPGDHPPISQRRRRSSSSFDDAEKEISQAHHRRRRNTGFRRFQHLMKKPEFSRKFWTITLSVGGALLLLLLLWDRFFRYVKPEG